MTVAIIIIDPEAWRRLRDVRLEALRESPAFFRHAYNEAVNQSEAQWRNMVRDQTHVMIEHDGLDVAILSIENVQGDYGATCWISGCWTRPSERGRGHLASLFRYLDDHAAAEGWQAQGLAALTHNLNAIATYEHLGFKKKGKTRSDPSHPGWSYQRMFRLTPGFVFTRRSNVAICWRRFRFILPEIRRRIHRG